MTYYWTLTWLRSQNCLPNKSMLVISFSSGNGTLEMKVTELWSWSWAPSDPLATWLKLKLLKNKPYDLNWTYSGLDITCMNYFNGHNTVSLVDHCCVTQPNVSKVQGKLDFQFIRFQFIWIIHPVDNRKQLTRSPLIPISPLNPGKPSSPWGKLVKENEYNFFFFNIRKNKQPFGLEQDVDRHDMKAHCTFSPLFPFNPRTPSAP